MNVNFLRKFFMLVLLVVGCAGGAWADDASSAAVVELIFSNGNKQEFTKLYDAAEYVRKNTKEDVTIRCLADYNENYAVSVGLATDESHTITLDLNGHTIGFNSAFSLGTKGTKLKLTDAATGGELKMNQTSWIGLRSDAEIEIVSGTYDISGFLISGTLTISGGKLYAHGDEPIKVIDSKAKVNITGGFFKEDNNQNGFSKYFAEGYKAGENVTMGGYYTIIPSSAVAMNYAADGTLSGTYDTFEEAVSNAADGTTIRMCEDCKVYGCKVDEGKNIRLDLNGKTLTKGDKEFEVCGTLTIQDESASQSGTFKAAISYPAVDIQANATLNIVSGNFITSSYDEIFGNLGTINIYGGKFSYNGILSRNTEGFTMSVCGGFFNKNTIYVSVDNDVTKKYQWTKYIADGFMLIDNSGVDGYPYAVVPLGANLTYGDGTTVKAPVYNGLTLDLKDDESDHNAWVSKIDVPKDTDPTDVTVKKNFANTNWHAFYVPFDINVSEDLLQNFEIAKIWDTELNLDDNSTTIEFIKLKDGEKIPAFTPCLIKAKATGKQDITFPNVTVYKNQTKSIDCSNVDETFTFTGVMENTSINGCYALKSETNSLVLANSANAQVTPLKFYMTVESKTPATSIKSKKFAVRVIGDETTGISDINAGGTDAKAANATVYNVQGAAVGTSLNGLPAGLYIQNGRKVVVK